MQTNPTQPRRSRPLWLYAIVGAFLLLTLAVGMPAWASSTPEEWQQGTVPPPPTATATPVDDDDNQPSATATPAAGGATSAPAPTPVGTPSRYTGVVNAPRLNVRSGPGVEFGVLGRLFEGEEVQILFRDAAGDWWYTCCISGTTTSGWVSALFVTPTFDAADALALIPQAENVEAATSLTVTTGITDATVSTFRLNLRSEPSISGTILGKLDNGTVVTVIARNAAGDWWYVCCAPDGDTSGWAAAQFLEPAFPRASAARVIPLFGGGVVLPTPTPGPRSTPSADSTTPTTATEVSGIAAGDTLTETETGATLALTATLETTATLEISASQAPTLAVQGAPLELRYVISNTGAVTATAVELRNELPAGLTLNRGNAAGGARFTAARTDAGADLFAFLWPELAPGGVITASAVVTVSATLSDGVVVENLAALSAANAEAQTAVLNIGLPPSGVPDFR